MSNHLVLLAPLRREVGQRIYHKVGWTETRTVCGRLIRPGADRRRWPSVWDGSRLCERCAGKGGAE